MKTFKHVFDYKFEEHQVLVFDEKGNPINSETYFTMDKEDAQVTMAMMIAQEGVRNSLSKKDQIYDPSSKTFDITSFLC